MSEQLLNTIQTAIELDEKSAIEVKNKPCVMRSFRLAAPLSAWLEITAKRTGLTHTDILEYALLAAATPLSNLSFYQLAELHKAKAVKQGKKWTTRRTQSFIREDLEAAPLVYGQDRKSALESWKRALLELPQEKHARRGRPRKLTLS